MTLNQALRFHLHHKFNIDFGETPTMRMLIVGLVAEEWYWICDLISWDCFNHMSEDDVDTIAKEVKAFLKFYNVVVVSNEKRHSTSSCGKYFDMEMTVKSGHYGCVIHYTANPNSKQEFIYRHSSVRMYTDEADCGSTGVRIGVGYELVLQKPVDSIKQPIV